MLHFIFLSDNCLLPFSPCLARLPGWYVNVFLQKHDNIDVSLHKADGGEGNLSPSQMPVLLMKVKRVLS